MYDLKEITHSSRKGIKRAVARFCYLKDIPLSESQLNILVRRTQESGYKSAIRFLSIYLDNLIKTKSKKKQLLFQFTIEYNTELYCKQFPNGNKAINRILSGDKTPDDDKFFKETLYEIVKANKLQIEIINNYI